MKENISKTTCKKADKCPNKLECLQNEDFEICPVVDFISDEIIFVEAQYYKSCPYMLPFADSNICHCPVRIEIYSKYKK